MAGKVYEIGFKIAGDLSGTFSKSFKNANKAVETFSDKLNALNKQAADVSAMAKLRKQIGENARTYIQAKQRVEELGKQISATKNPSKELIAEFNKQKAAMTKAKNAVDRQRISLKELETATGMAGADIKKLTERENELARAADRARAAQEKQQKAISGMKSGMAGAKENAGYAGASAAAMGGGLVAAVKQAMSFEDQTAELRKYSDEADTIFNDIIGLTRKYAKTSEDMTNMAAAAMQAGIAKTGKDVITIVEQQTQAAVAFGMTGDEVGSAWADIQSKMGMSVDQTKDVFDIVNQISNTTSASAEGIIEVLQRQGGTLKGLTALTSEQITALAGAFRSAAPSAEVAATSMGTFIGRLTTGDAATKAQRDALSKLGMDSVTLAKQLTGTSETAQSAIQNVFAQINKLPAHEQGAVIGQLFGTEAGIKSAVSTLASQANILGGNLTTVADKSNYAGSMFGEYSSRANTTSNALQILQNNVAEVAGKIGTNFIPQIKAAAKWIQDNSTKIVAWVEQNKGLITTIGYVAAGLAGLFAAAVPLFVAFKTLAFYGNLLKMGYHALSLVFQKTTWIMIKNFAVMLTNPIGLVIAGIVALVAIGIVLYKNWDVIKAKCVELWAMFSAKFPNLAAIAKGAFNLVVAGAKWLWSGLKWAFDAIIAYLQHLWSFWSGVFQGIWNALKVWFNGVKTIFVNVLTIFDNIIGFVKNVFTGNWQSAWENVKNILGAVFSSLVTVVKTPINSIISLVNGAISGINKALGGVKIPDWVPGLGGKSIGINIPQIPQLAEGGIATRSTIANIGEGREPEAVLPLSKLSSMLGNSGGSSGSNISISFSPTINVSGGEGDVYGQVKRGLDAGRVELEKAIEQILAKKRRLSYV